MPMSLLLYGDGGGSLEKAWPGHAQATLIPHRLGATQQEMKAGGTVRSLKDGDMTSHVWECGQQGANRGQDTEKLSK